MALLAWGNTGIFDPHSHHFTVRHSCGQKKIMYIHQKIGYDSDLPG